MNDPTASGHGHEKSTNYLNLLKCSGVRQSHLKVFSAIQV